MRSGERLKVSVSRYSCIEEMPVVSDINGSECILLGLVVVIAVVSKSEQFSNCSNPVMAALRFAASRRRNQSERSNAAIQWT